MRALNQSEIVRDYQKRGLKVYSSTPSAKQVRNNSSFIIDDGSKVYLGTRVGSRIMKVEVT